MADWRCGGSLTGDAVVHWWWFSGDVVVHCRCCESLMKMIVVHW